jgi:hypothetical protein
VFAAALLGALAGCGQKGPLYVVGEPKRAVWPYPPRPAPKAPAAAAPTPPASAGRSPDAAAPTALPGTSDIKP